MAFEVIVQGSLFSLLLVPLHMSIWIKCCYSCRRIKVQIRIQRNKPGTIMKVLICGVHST